MEPLQMPGPSHKDMCLSPIPTRCPSNALERGYKWCTSQPAGLRRTDVSHTALNVQADRVRVQADVKEVQSGNRMPFHARDAPRSRQATAFSTLDQCSCSPACRITRVSGLLDMNSKTQV